MFFYRLAYGNESGLVIVDIVQKVTLLVMSTSDFGSTTDPYQRALRSPKKQDEAKRENDDKARSPSIDQVNFNNYKIGFNFILPLFVLSSLLVRVYLWILNIKNYSIHVSTK